MKKISILFLTIMAIAMAGCSFTKEVSEVDIAKHEEAVEQLKDQNFLFKASRLTLNKHSFPSISPSTNFILVEGNEATVQVSPGTGGGPNGVGGFTVKGNISGYEVKEKSDGGVSVKFNVMASVGSCSVFINMPKNATSANVTIQNTFRGKNATLYGQVDKIDNSIFAGRTRY